MFHLYLKCKLVSISVKTTYIFTHTHKKDKSVVQMTKSGKFILEICSCANPPLRSLEDATCSVLYTIHHLWNTPFTTKKRGGGGHCQPNVHFLCQHTSSALPLAFSLVLINCLLWAKIISLNDETQLFTFMPVNHTWYV